MSIEEDSRDLPALFLTQVRLCFAYSISFFCLLICSYKCRKRKKKKKERRGVLALHSGGKVFHQYFKVALCLLFSVENMVVLP